MNQFVSTMVVPNHFFASLVHSEHRRVADLIKENGNYENIPLSENETIRGLLPHYVDISEEAAQAMVCLITKKHGFNQSHIVSCGLFNPAKFRGISSERFVVFLSPSLISLARDERAKALYNLILCMQACMRGRAQGSALLICREETAPIIEEVREYERELWISRNPHLVHRITQGDPEVKMISDFSDGIPKLIERAPYQRLHEKLSSRYADYVLFGLAQQAHSKGIKLAFCESGERAVFKGSRESLFKD